MKYILDFNRNILEFEKNHQWYNAANLLYELWLADKSSINNLICAGTECWFGILAMDYDKHDPNNNTAFDAYAENQLYDMLSCITQYGFAHFLDNAVFNAYFGYMIKTMPYFFLNYSGDYERWQAKGIQMMEFSSILEPNNPFTKAISYEPGSATNDTLYRDACKELWSKTTLAEWGNSAVQRYFFGVLYGDLFTSGLTDGRTGDGTLS